jgi:hypothetical protein
MYRIDDQPNLVRMCPSQSTYRLDFQFLRTGREAALYVLRCEAPNAHKKRLILR